MIHDTSARTSAKEALFAALASDLMNHLPNAAALATREGVIALLQAELLLTGRLLGMLANALAYEYGDTEIGDVISALGIRLVIVPRS